MRERKEQNMEEEMILLKEVAFINILVSAVIGFTLGWFALPRFIVWVKIKCGIKGPHNKNR